MREPRAFGQWGAIATPGEILMGSAFTLAGDCDDSDNRGPWQRVARVKLWLPAPRRRRLRPGVLEVLGWCDSAAELTTALAFADDELEALDVVSYLPRALTIRGETLELQVPIAGTPYVADFRWTSHHGPAFVEVYGQTAHLHRHDADRARHERITALGHVVHYVPAEAVRTAQRAIWPALRRRARATTEGAAAAALVEARR